MRSHATGQDTIAAISTPPGEGGLGVVRVSGPEALAIAETMFRAKNGGRVCGQKNFTARYGRVVRGDETVDEALLLVMRGPKSYTGEDVAEFSVHGGTAVLNAVVGTALASGARAAEPGEFTKRAFLSGRIDLVQAEAVLDLIVSKTEKARRWAASRLEGGLSQKISSLRETLITVLSRLEAVIDFPEDVPASVAAEGIRALENAAQESIILLKGSELGLLAKRGLSAVIWGRPNVGKSSLLNRLAGSDRVIVTPYPGTTRDTVEEEIEIAGFPVRLSDTAGVQETVHPIEREGIQRSRKAVASADLVLFVLDGTRGWGEEDEALFADVESKPKLILVNKADLPLKISKKILQNKAPDIPIIDCSCQTGQGLESVRAAIAGILGRGDAAVSENAVAGTLRQRDLLEKVAASIEAARETAAGGLSPEFVATDVRAALDHLSQLVGETAPDDVLDELFSRFCIGK